MPKKHEETSVDNIVDESEAVSKDFHRGTTAHAYRELHIPLSSRAVFWQPRHVSVSDELIHVPYLFWLMETTRPRKIVQIGLNEGVGFLAICQAVDKLNLEVPCIGIVPSYGEETALELPLPCHLKEQHATHYGDFSYIEQLSADRAKALLNHDEIDLLVVNTELSEALATRLMTIFQSCLSDRASVVFMGEAKSGQPAVLTEFSAQHQSIRLQQDNQVIETILVGKNQPERLLRLSRLELGAPGALAARQVFSRLGQGLLNTERAKATKAELEKARSSVAMLEQELNSTEKDLVTLREECASAFAAEDDQFKQLAKLQAHLFDKTTEAEKLRAELAEKDRNRDLLRAKCDQFSARALEHERKIAQAEEAHEAARAQLSEEVVRERLARETAEARALEHERKIAQAEEAHEAARAQLSEEVARERLARETAEARAAWEHELLTRAEKNIEARMAEIAALTADYEQRLNQSERSVTETRQQLQAQISENTVLKKQAEKQRKELEKFLESTSWKITAPARKIVDAARGNRKPTAS